MAGTGRVPTAPLPRKSLIKPRKTTQAGGDVVLGHLPKDQHQGALAALWASKLADAPGVTAADASGGFADLFGCKDEAEILNVKKAAFLSSKVRLRGRMGCGVAGVAGSSRGGAAGGQRVAGAAPRALSRGAAPRRPSPLWPLDSQPRASPSPSRPPSQPRPRCPLSQVMAHVVEKLEEIIDQEKKVKHSKLSGGQHTGMWEGTYCNAFIPAGRCVGQPPPHPTPAQVALRDSDPLAPTHPPTRIPPPPPTAPQPQRSWRAW